MTVLLAKRSQDATTRDQNCRISKTLGTFAPNRHGNSPQHAGKRNKAEGFV
jgi:hypothetical protein